MRCDCTKSRIGLIAMAALCAAVFSVPRTAQALSDETLRSVVSVLPVWPGRPQGGSGAPTGSAPEGTGIVIGPDGLVATAFHVIEPAERIDVRLHDGRIVPAAVVGVDAASDIALLRIEPVLPAFDLAGAQALGAPVCAIGNAYGLGLSVTCGVVSARHVAVAGFNTIEDFVQTDAAANPGSSGGALVDADGRLVGMVSAIFASGSETNIGINFAISAELLRRVADDLLDDGKVSYVDAGWALEVPSRDVQARHAGVLVTRLAASGPAAGAGTRIGDLVTRIGDRPVREPRDATSALALVRPEESVAVTLIRADQPVTVELDFADSAAASDQAGAKADCPYPEPVCRARQAVFPVESFDLLASSVRIGADLLVTNRHVVADRRSAVVFTPIGPVLGTVVPSAYRGDLALIRVAGLPQDGTILSADDAGAVLEPLHAVGADTARRQVRVFPGGARILGPAPEARFGRLQVSSFMQPGVSGGALVGQNGGLAGIATGGGDGRFEAIPAADIARVIAGMTADDAATVHAGLGAALAACAKALDEIDSSRPDQPDRLGLEDQCLLADNHGQMLRAGRVAGVLGRYDTAIRLHQAAVDQSPNSINARLSLMVSLQLAGRFSEMVPHAAFLITVLPSDPDVLRRALQAGVWGGDLALAETAVGLMDQANLRGAVAARRFLDNPPPAPVAR